MNIFGIGHAMTDVFVQVDKKNFALPLPLQEKKATHVESSVMTNILKDLSHFSTIKKSGGTSVNILKTLKKKGSNCFFVGTIGSESQTEQQKDKIGIFFQKELAKLGIQSLLKTGTDSSGIFLKIDFNNSFALAASPASAKQIKTKQIPPQELKKADAIVIEGMISLNDKVFDFLTDFCKKNNKLLVIDCGSVFAAKNLWQNLKKLCGAKTIIFANEDEFETLFDKDEINSVDDFFVQINATESPYPILIQKQGKKGATCYTKEKDSVNSIFCQQQNPMEAIDATGAGDTFAGSFVYEWLQNQNFPCLQEKILYCMECANAEAAKVLTTFGI